MSVTDYGGIRAHDATSGIGYGTGAGGAVTQATNKTTGVTSNTASGQITMNNASMATSAVVGFVLTNSTIETTDTVIVNVDSGASAATSYIVGVGAVGAGVCTIVVQNIAGAPVAEAIVLNYAVVKAATS